MAGDTKPPPNPDDGKPPDPRKLTDALIEGFVRLLLAGNFRQVAAKRLGVHITTLRRWMRLGRRYPDGIYARLRSAVLAAEAEFEASAVAQIRVAGADDPAHLEWLLERKFPMRWGRFRGELGLLKKRLAELEKALAADRDDGEAGGDPADWQVR